MLNKKQFVVSMMVMMMVLLSGCSGKEVKKERDWATIKEKGELVIGVDDTFVPMGFLDEAGTLTGFDIELARAVGDDLGVKVTFQSIDWPMKETELKNGSIDLIWNGYSVTEERAEKVLFSNSYLKNDQVLVTNKTIGIDTSADMKEKKLGAQEGSSGADMFEKQPEVLKDLVASNEAILFPTFTEAFLDLENNRIDGLLIDRVFAEYYLTQTGKISDYLIIDTEFPEEDFAIGARLTDGQLVGELNKSLKRVTETGVAESLSEKWFGENRVLTQP